MIIPIEQNLDYVGVDRLTVYNSLSIQDQVKKDCLALSSVLRSNNPIYADFMAAVKAASEYQYGGGVDFNYAYDIDLKVIRELGGSAYFPELDIVITIKDVAEPPPHPYSKIKTAKDAMVPRENLQEGAYVSSIMLVDNAGLIGKKWMKLYGKPVALMPVKMPRLGDGVYFYTDPEEGEVEGEVLYITPDDFTNKGIFHSLEDLEDRDRKAEVARLELLAATEKSKTKILENNIAREKSVRDDFYDTRSNGRKESSEVLKFIPTVIVGLGAMLMALKSFKIF